MKKLAILTLCYSTSLFALPSGGQVIQGDACFSSSSDSLQIHAQGKAIFQWEGFNIASHESVCFTSQRSEAILNRIASSAICWRLQASTSRLMGQAKSLLPGQS